MSQKRSIFEEVQSAKVDASRPQPGLIDQNRGGARRAVRLWLMALFALLVAMIAIGGLTRLTDSGLSITEWNLIKGAVPPTSAQAWDQAFAKYQETPEYQLQNKDMSLSAFKIIYWWEWGHRQLGRFIGLVWAAGFVTFWATKRIPVGWTTRLVSIGALGGVQGAIGWWMVRSGLSGARVDVASYRLAIHLGLAFIILGLIAWFVVLLSRQEAELMQARRNKDRPLVNLTNALMALVFVQILLGALVAGIDAGRSYTDWPLMAGRWFPQGRFDLTPLWRNFFEDAGLVQFMHRMSAYAVFVFGVYVWRRSRASGNIATKRAFDAVALMLIAQMGLGIATVITAAPAGIALAHQLGAVAFWVLLIRARLLAQYPPAQSVRKAAT
jgi:cytochrome c oxidase assembly protein subunit 15